MVTRRKSAVSEDWFNSELRAVLRAQGLSCMHVRETEKPGAADLLAWKGAEIVGWLELKIRDHGLDPQQREFLRDRDAESGIAFVVRYDPNGDRVTVERGVDALWDRLQVQEALLEGTWRTVRWAHLLWRLRRDGLRYK